MSIEEFNDIWKSYLVQLNNMYSFLLFDNTLSLATIYISYHAYTTKYDCIDFVFARITIVSDLN